MNKLASAFLEYRDMLRTDNLDIIVGKPDYLPNSIYNSPNSIYFWPWALELAGSPMRNRPIGVEPRVPRLQSTQLPKLEFLIMITLLSTTDTVVDGLRKLESVHQAIDENPILHLQDGTRCEVFLYQLPTEQLTQILSAASLQLNLCLSATLRLA
jgi:hypothetical protein